MRNVVFRCEIHTVVWMSPIWRILLGPGRSPVRRGGWPRQRQRGAREVKNMKQAAALTDVAGGLAVAGAGVASAHSAPRPRARPWSSPGVVSGNLVQVPVHVPVNACRQHRQRHRRAQPGLRQPLRQPLTHGHPPHQRRQPGPAGNHLRGRCRLWLLCHRRRGRRFTGGARPDEHRPRRPPWSERHRRTENADRLRRLRTPPPTDGSRPGGAPRSPAGRVRSGNRRRRSRCLRLGERAGNAGAA